MLVISIEETAKQKTVQSAAVCSVFAFAAFFLFLLSERRRPCRKRRRSGAAVLPIKKIADGKQKAPLAIGKIHV